MSTEQSTAKEEQPEAKKPEESKTGEAPLQVEETSKSTEPVVDGSSDVKKVSVLLEKSEKADSATAPDGSTQEVSEAPNVNRGGRITRSRTGNSAPRKEEYIETIEVEPKRPAKRQKVAVEKAAKKRQSKASTTSTTNTKKETASTTPAGSATTPKTPGTAQKRKTTEKTVSTPKAKPPGATSSSSSSALKTSPGISMKNGKLTFTLKPINNVAAAATTTTTTPTTTKTSTTGAAKTSAAAKAVNKATNMSTNKDSKTPVANGVASNTNAVAAPGSPAAATTTNTTISTTGAPSNPEEPKKEKRKLLYAVKPPYLRPIESPLPPKILWARLAVRDFIIRFEKIEHIPARYFQALNNAGGEWDDRLYKSIVLMLFKILYYDSVQIVPYKLQRDYKKAVEKTQNNLPKIFALLDEFLYQSAFSPCLITPAEEQQLNVAPAEAVEGGAEVVNAPIDPVPKETLGSPELDSEYRHLVLLNKFIILASQTETIRSSVASIGEAMKMAQKTLNSDIEKAEATFDRQLQKIKEQRKDLRPNVENHSEKPKKVQLAELAQKEAALRQTRNAKLFRARETHFFAQRRFLTRTQPLGMDYFGNTYWHFQQKSRDMTDWGYWLVVERSSSVAHAFGLPQYLPKQMRVEEVVEDAEGGKSSAGGTGTAASAATSNGTSHGSAGSGGSGNKRKRVTSGGGQLYDEEVFGNARGRLYYMRMTKKEVEQLLSWLEYQRQVHLKPTTRTKKLLARDSSAETSQEGLVRYLKVLQPFALEDEEEEEEEKKSEEKTEVKGEEPSVGEKEEEQANGAISQVEEDTRMVDVF